MKKVQKRQPGNERRRDQRVKVKSGAFVVINHDKVGKIVDIGKNGISFLYESCDQLPGDEYFVDIIGLFDNDDNFYLHDIPMETVYERRLKKKAGECALVRSSVQFGELSPEQQKMLDFFIWSNLADHSPSLSWG